MALPAPNLDDLRFQRDLVDEARLRIIRYCPEWTEYNLSDPGITLIELFAWMTEMIVYRINKVPEKNYVRFLDMLGVQLQPAASARAELTFRLSAPFPLRPDDRTQALVPAGLEVATNATQDAPGVVFTTVDPLLIVPPQLTQLRGADFHKNYLPRLGIETFYTFRTDYPQVGDTFYIGFDEVNDISGHILQLAFECHRTEAVGIRREDPPLVWECSLGEGAWQEILPSTLEGEKDTTGGLNNEAGAITFYLPTAARPDVVYGRNAYWLRCRYEPRRPEQGRYSQSPRIRNVAAYTLGGTTTAAHAIYVYGEEMGVSNGDPGQVFNLLNAPVLDLNDEERVEVEELRDGELAFVPWQRVADFANSSRYDRHFALDTAAGQVSFGPSIRQPDGSVRQYGRVPEVGRRVRIRQYRHGGGVIGNVPAQQIQVMRSAVPYIDRVLNLRRASGGRDQETLAEAKERARRELRAQHRAVTAEDFENLARAATRDVARVQCLSPASNMAHLPPGMLELLVVPSVHDSIAAGDLAKLELREELADRLQAYLDRYRLLTTTLRIREPQYIGVRVRAEIVAGEFSRQDVVVGRVVEALRRFISPLPLEVSAEPPVDASGQASTLPGVLGEDWQGWPFGRSLFTAELFSLIQQVPGVKHVLDVQLFQRPLLPSKESAPLGQLEEYAERVASGAERAELAPVKGRSLAVPADGLLCSLDHEVVVVEL